MTMISFERYGIKQPYTLRYLAIAYPMRNMWLSSIGRAKKPFALTTRRTCLSPDIESIGVEGDVTAYRISRSDNVDLLCARLSNRLYFFKRQNYAVTCNVSHILHNSFNLCEIFNKLNIKFFKCICLLCRQSSNGCRNIFWI
uniref:CNH domain-containing protein n=1 Tax=Heterorhabditis bacteriophora TaxID=37862 RepID=A0A1I7WZ67_HETBA